MAQPRSNPASRPLKLLRAGNVLRVAAGLALIALLYRWHVIDLAALGGLAARPGIVVLAALLTVASIPLEGLRWHVLLRSQGLTLALGRTMRVLAVSLFFANFLPGGAGGDVVRIVYLYRAAPGRRAAALLSIAMDRLVSFVAFMLVGLGAVLALPAAKSAALLPAAAGLSALLLAALAGLFVFGHRLGALLQRLLAGRSTRLAGIVDDLGLALHQFARDRRRLGIAFLLSLAIAFLSVAPIVLLAGGLGSGRLTPLDAFVAGLYAQIANSVPVTPGGLGVGEAAFASLAALLDPAAQAAAYGTVFLAFRVVFLIATTPGLFLYLIEA